MLVDDVEPCARCGRRDGLLVAVVSRREHEQHSRKTNLPPKTSSAAEGEWQIAGRSAFHIIS